MKNYQSKLGDLANKLKQKPPNIPIQEVKPIGESKEKPEEVQFNNWIPKSLLKRLKTHALEQEKSLKDINIEALEHYLQGEGI